MDIILNQDIPKLGYKGDVVKVKPGYARNYLIPKGIAMVANSQNRKVLAENMKQAAHKLAKVKDDAQLKANQISSTELDIAVKTGASGKIFGSITTLQISNLLKEQGIEVDRRMITVKDPIKSVGNYTVSVELHREVEAELRLNVKAEE